MGVSQRRPRAQWLRVWALDSDGSRPVTCYLWHLRVQKIKELQLPPRWNGFTLTGLEWRLCNGSQMFSAAWDTGSAQWMTAALTTLWLFESSENRHRNQTWLCGGTWWAAGTWATQNRHFSSPYEAGLRRSLDLCSVPWQQEFEFRGDTDERARRDGILGLWGP